MSLPWGSEPGIALLVPVTTVEQGAGAAASGAGLVDAGRDGALVPAIRRAVGGVRVCGEKLLLERIPLEKLAIIRTGEVEPYAAT